MIFFYIYLIEQNIKIMVKLERNQMSLILGGATCTAYCTNPNTGHDYTISCSGGSSCSSSDYNGCSSGSDVKSCGGGPMQ